MNIQIIAVGKLKEKYWIDAISEYMKRLGPYAKMQITEIPEEKASDSMSEAEEQQIRSREGDRILGQIKKEAYVIAMAIEGATWSSEELAEHVEQLGIKGKSHLVFIIGGSLGLASSVMSRADQKLSFGRITYPHQLMRVVLVEQVYRAFKILRGEPYHK